MNYFLLDAAGTAAKAPGATGILTQIFPFALMFLVLYMFIIRPQKRKQKEHQEMLQNVKINDKVITNAGIIGKVVNIKKDKNILVIKVDATTNTKIEFQRSAISTIIKDEKQETTAKN
ncbi:MAG: preprotein translocase subunit YajC [Candidatus Cloacimonetes bacterium]|nr:preprotein translocase subunit YajC [Candidatus Cloacimonadota bacterium]